MDFLRGLAAVLPLDSINLSPYVAEERTPRLKKDGAVRGGTIHDIRADTRLGLSGHRRCAGVMRFLPVEIRFAAPANMPFGHFCEGSKK